MFLVKTTKKKTSKTKKINTKRNKNLEGSEKYKKITKQITFFLTKRTQSETFLYNIYICIYTRICIYFMLIRSQSNITNKNHSLLIKIFKTLNILHLKEV